MKNRRGAQKTLFFFGHNHKLLGTFRNSTSFSWNIYPVVNPKSIKKSWKIHHNSIKHPYRTSSWGHKTREQGIWHFSTEVMPMILYPAVRQCRGTDVSFQKAASQYWDNPPIIYPYFAIKTSIYSLDNGDLHTLWLWLTVCHGKSTHF